MMVWLREPHAGEAAVGLDCDIIPARAHATLMALDDACLAVRAACDAELAQARSRAAATLQQAEEQAAALLSEARKSFDEAAARGAEQGRLQAVAQWWEEAGAALEVRRAARQSSRDHVASLVVEAVNRIVRSSAPADLFARAAQTVDGIIAESGTLAVRVHVDDCEAARAEFGALVERWRSLGRPVSLTVSTAPDLPPGACVCHTDVGTIDASLDVQLRALELVVQRALEQDE